MNDDWPFVLQEQNYILIRRSDNLYSLCKIKETIGMNKVKSARLVAKNDADSRQNTLSSRYGLHTFPPHTDGAIENLPPHYIMLISPNPRTVKTYLYRFSDVEAALGKAILNSALFQVAGARKRFYSGIVVSGELPFYRYNPAIMHPINHDAALVSNYINQKLLPCLIIDWIDTRAAIINNRTILHSRGEIIEKTRINHLRRLSLWS
jgi:hypothetical protein